MANKRIKDLGTTASTLAADDYVAIDGNANGTRKIVKGDLVNDISTQVAGTYLDEANNLSDVASKDTSKLNLEVPDVGTAPNEVPLNGQLGSMAYQDADSVAMAMAQIESTTGTATTQALTVTDGTDTNFVVQEDGKTGIGTASPDAPLSVESSSSPKVTLGYGGSNAQHQLTWDSSKFNIAADAGNAVANSEIAFWVDGTKRATIDSSGNVGIGGSPTYELDVQAGNARIAATSDAGVVNHLQADNTGAWVGPLSNHNLYFKTNNTTRWTVTAGGNLVSAGGRIDIPTGGGIYFNNTDDAAGAVSEIFDDYESGTLTATLTPSTSGSITVDSNFNTLAYEKVGNLVTVTGKLVVSSVSSPVGAYVNLNLPFTIGGSNQHRTAGTVLISAAASNVNTYAIFTGSMAYICRTDATSLSSGTAAADFSGDEELMINISYIAD